MQRVSGAEQLLVVGLFGNIRSMTPLLVVSASKEFQAVERKIWPAISNHSFLVLYTLYFKLYLSSLISAGFTMCYLVQIFSISIKKNKVFLSGDSPT